MSDVSKKQYENEFSSKKSSKQNTIRSKALEQALDTRKFEIELYWKRANYFWAFIAAIFAGYFLLLGSEKTKVTDDMLFLVSSLGFVFSLGWYLANRGSKFWQENWEKHVDSLEDKVIGPLYKTTLDKKSCCFLKIHKEYGFSVSKINQILSLYVVIIWGFIGTRLFLKSYNGSISSMMQSPEGLNIIFFMGITLFATVCLIFLGQTNQKEKRGKHKFIRR